MNINVVKFNVWACISTLTGKGKIRSRVFASDLYKKTKNRPKGPLCVNNEGWRSFSQGSQSRLNLLELLSFNPPLYFQICRIGRFNTMAERTILALTAKIRGRRILIQSFFAPREPYNTAQFHNAFQKDSESMRNMSGKIDCNLSLDWKVATIMPQSTRRTGRQRN